MLFKFGKFWKTVLFLVGSWTLYGIYGFEFTVITVLSLICAQKFTDKHRLL